MEKETIALKISGEVDQPHLENEDKLLSFEDCISVLTSNEGDSVTILALNPDADCSNEMYAIDVNGEWTHWRDERHPGDTQLAALKKAARFKRILER